MRCILLLLLKNTIYLYTFTLYFLHMNVVCPGIKLIPLIYQHIAILVRFTQNLYLFFALTVFILATLA